MFEEHCLHCSQLKRYCVCGRPPGIGTRIERAVPRWMATRTCGCQRLKDQWDALGLYGTINALPHIRVTLTTHLDRWIGFRPLSAAIVRIWLSLNMRRYQQEYEKWLSDKKLYKK